MPVLESFCRNKAKTGVYIYTWLQFTTWWGRARQPNLRTIALTPCRTSRDVVLFLHCPAPSTFGPLTRRPSWKSGLHCMMYPLTQLSPLLNVWSLSQPPSIRPLRRPSSSIIIVSGQRIPIIRRRQVLTNVDHGQKSRFLDMQIDQRF